MVVTCRQGQGQRSGHLIPPDAWPSMYISLRWGGGGCHGDMSTKPRSKVRSIYIYEQHVGHGR